MGATSVLVVEDDNDTREALVDLLKDEGYQVYEAPNGKPALEQLRVHPVGMVVLLDLMMPGMDGQAVLKAVAAEAPLAKRHTFILMTARGRTLPLPVLELLRQLNVTLVTKPFDIFDLLRMVATAASKLP